eukprot:TRINITY_DN15322_c0_g1_i1.p1 TRINITY_DN15322_c0_g1~~TRINITY_DN15322_c0_g1_i1.p1  ORF type:complete len:431 (-),score=90.91 TRINITY_DN15322_c0_g1_i1:212-1504(-)
MSRKGKGQSDLLNNVSIDKPNSVTCSLLGVVRSSSQFKHTRSFKPSFAENVVPKGLTKLNQVPATQRTLVGPPAQSFTCKIVPTTQGPKGNSDREGRFRFEGEQSNKLHPSDFNRGFPRLTSSSPLLPLLSPTMDMGMANLKREMTSQGNLLAAFGYESEIHAHLLSVESCLGVINWSSQSVTPKMRAILVDWLIEVGEEYQLRDQTLFLSIQYLDRCLHRNLYVDKVTLQLLGITCLFLASKVEEVIPPKIDEFVYITDNTYTRQQVVDQESLILDSLEFRLHVVTISDFLPTFLNFFSIHLHDEEKSSFANYLSHVILTCFEVGQRYKPSELAAAITIITLSSFEAISPHDCVSLLGNSNLLKTTTVDVLKECIRAVRTAVSTSCFSAAYDKFNSPKHGYASRVAISVSLGKGCGGVSSDGGIVDRMA